VGYGCGQGRRPFEAEANDEARLVFPCIAVALYDADLGDVVSGVEADEPVLHRQLGPPRALHGDAHVE
jgi:hypothetical protein